MVVLLLKQQSYEIQMMKKNKKDDEFEIEWNEEDENEI